MPSPCDKKPARTPDRSPENDLRKMLDHGRLARMKFVRVGNEERAQHVLDITSRVEMLLSMLSKPEPAK